MDYLDNWFDVDVCRSGTGYGHPWRPFFQLRLVL